ncbi:MAG: trypsin-like peptidase domain-containing protein [Ruminococcus sp.]|jgi:serine protease Do|nr:trypsin-like peptidase domain-containing protein [Ruminococcus sp.]
MNNRNNINLIRLMIIAMLVLAFTVVTSATAMSVSSKNQGIPVSDEVYGIAVKSATDFAEKQAMSIPDVIDKIKPTVVGISTIFNDEIRGTGTGIIISKDGKIVTNAHVVSDSTLEPENELPQSVCVVLADKTEHEAEILGYDTETDLAVIKIDTEGLDLITAPFGDSTGLREGDEAIAIGNPLGFELYGSTTRGIISALDRTITIGENEMTLIQTDAAINPGNSGGPLCNIYGEVIGINSSKIISVYAEGIGFAIPSKEALPVVNDLINYGFVRGRPVIGFSGEDIDETQANFYNVPMGVLIRFVTPGSAAAESGICPGDIIVAVNGTKIRTMGELNKIKKGSAVGDSIELTYYRPSKDSMWTTELILTEHR